VSVYQDRLTGNEGMIQSGLAVGWERWGREAR